MGIDTYIRDARSHMIPPTVKFMTILEKLVITIGTILHVTVSHITVCS